MHYKIRVIATIFCLFLVPNTSELVLAQSYQSWQAGQEQEPQDFQKKTDQQFYDFLQKQWQKFQVVAGQPEDPAPKPDTIPRAPEKPEPPLPGKTISLTFFEKRYRFPALKALGRLTPVSVNKKGVAAFWKNFAAAETASLLLRLGFYRQADNINDWVYLKLVERLDQELYDDANLSRLFAWAIMLKSGYDLRVGFDGETIHLLYPVTDRLYNMPYFTLDQKWYYLHSGRADRLYTYKAGYQPAEKDEVSAANNQGGQDNITVILFARQ